MADQLLYTVWLRVTEYGGCALEDAPPEVHHVMASTSRLAIRAAIMICLGDPLLPDEDAARGWVWEQRDDGSILALKRELGRTVCARLEWAWSRGWLWQSVPSPEVRHA